MDATYLSGYRTIYERHWWWRAREALLTSEIARLANGRFVGPILDVGCGDGLFFPVLSRFGEPYGVEPAAEALTPDGPWRSRIHAGQLDESFASPEFPFSLILALDVVEHLHDPGPFLSRARTLLAPGGWFLATVPAFRSLWTAHDDLNEHVTRYTRDEFVALLNQHGFQVVHARYFFVLLALAKAAVRLIEGIRRPALHPPTIPAAPINAALQLVCRAEQRLLGRHAPWFGSSLLVVARATTD